LRALKLNFFRNRLVFDFLLHHRLSTPWYLPKRISGSARARRWPANPNRLTTHRSTRETAEIVLFPAPENKKFTLRPLRLERSGR
jgi:hypothetical protein